MSQVAVRIYSPKLTALPEESALDRARRLVLAAKAAPAKTNLFVAPEYFFTHHSSRLLSVDRCLAYSADEADAAREVILAGTVGLQLTVVAGSFLMVQGVYNTSFVYRAGAKVVECSKKSAAADKRYAELCKLDFYPGDGGWAFACNDVGCYLQICQDASGDPGTNHALSVMPAFAPGAAVLGGMKRFLARVVADGTGNCMVLYQAEALKKKLVAAETCDVLLTFSDETVTAEFA
jgi:predicted amidohydrolase